MTEKKQIEKIQKAALLVFSEKGYSGARITEIATKANVNPATIYRFYKSKQELFKSLQRPDLDFPDDQEKQMRQRIINGALRVFSQKGYFTTTMDEIAEEINLSKPAIYFYYPSKETLFSAVLDNPIGFKLLESSMKQFLSDDHADFKTGLIHLAETYLSLFQNTESLSLLKIVLSTGVLNTEIATGFTERIIKRGAKNVAGYVRRFCSLDEEKLLFSIQAFFGMLFAWGLRNAIFVQELDLGPTEVQNAAREIVNQFIYGIQDSIKGIQTEEN